MPDWESLRPPRPVNVVVAYSFSCRPGHRVPGLLRVSKCASACRTWDSPCSWWYPWPFCGRLSLRFWHLLPWWISHDVSNVCAAWSANLAAVDGVCSEIPTRDSTGDPLARLWAASRPISTLANRGPSAPAI